MPNVKKKSVIFTIAIFFAVLLVLIYIINSYENKKIVIHYAAWNLGDSSDAGLERQMVEEYKKMHPNVDILIEEAFVANYDQAMQEAAKLNEIPDVFMYSGNATVEENDWCMDLTKIVEKDKEWSNIPKVLADATYIKGKVVAIPSAIYLYGYYCNNDVLTQSGIKKIDSGISLETFTKYVKDSTNIEEGRIGLGDASSICEWYPAAVNKRLGWFSWDGGKLNLNVNEFMEGLVLEKEFYTGKYTFGMLDESDKEKLQAEGDWEAWNEGNVAFKFDGTWSVSNYSKISKEMRFIGMPGGRTCIVPDFLFVSKNSQYPKEAYEFAKYMSAYSSEGFDKRIQLAKKSELEVTSLPMIANEDITEEYFSLIHMEGIEEAYRNFVTNPSQAYVEATKVLPGYPVARWNYVTNFSTSTSEKATIGDVILACARGELEYSEISEDINYMANSSILMYPQQLND